MTTTRRDLLRALGLGGVAGIVPLSVASPKTAPKGADVAVLSLGGLVEHEDGLLSTTLRANYAGGDGDHYVSLAIDPQKINLDAAQSMLLKFQALLATHNEFTACRSEGGRTNTHIEEWRRSIHANVWSRRGERE